MKYCIKEELQQIQGLLRDGYDIVDLTEDDKDTKGESK